MDKDEEKEINIAIMEQLWEAKLLMTRKGGRVWQAGNLIIAEDQVLNPYCLSSRSIPNFTRSHQLCAEFVDVLEQWDQGASSISKDYASACYINELGKIVGIRLKTVTIISKPCNLNTAVYSNPWEPLKLLRATPLQKCQAFLKAIEGKTRNKCMCGAVATEHCPEHGT